MSNVIKTVIMVAAVMSFIMSCGKEDMNILPTSEAEDSVMESSELSETEISDKIGDVTLIDENRTEEMGISKETEDIESIVQEEVTETDMVEVETGEDKNIQVESEDEEHTGGNQTVDVMARTDIVQDESVPLPEPVQMTQEEVKPESVHIHNYSCSITANPICENEGVMTYICDCGSSYNEPIAATGHKWVASTETIHHPEEGYMDRTAREIMKFRCRCGYITDDWDDYQRHCIEAVSQCSNADEVLNCPCSGAYIMWNDTVYDEKWIVTREAYDEVVSKNTCLICGAVQ